MKNLFFILILSTILRISTVPNLLSFTSDEAYQAYISQTLLKDFHIIWIGLSAGGFDTYLGPYWNYIIAPFLFVSKGDPVVLGYIASILGIFATFLLYLVGKKLFNERVAILATLLYASLPLIIYYDQKPYPSGIPFLSLLITFSIYMARYSAKWWIIFAIAYGMVFHIHLSLIPVVFVAIYWAFLYRKLITKKIVVCSLLAFIIMISPLIAFDYFHKASNITAPFKVFTSIKKGSFKLDTSNRINTLLDSVGRVWYLSPYKNNADEILYPCRITEFSTRTKSNIIMSLATFILFFSYLLNKKAWKDPRTRLLLLLSLSYLIPYTILSIISPVEYYLLGFYPLLFLLVSLAIESSKGFYKPFLYFMILTIAFLGVFTLINAKEDFGLNVKKRLITQVMNTIGDNPYYLNAEGICHKFEGWRYLFSVYGNRPERSFEDEIFAWLYPEEISKKVTEYSVIIKETRTPVPIDQNYKFIIKEGGFSAYIFDH